MQPHIPIDQEKITAFCKKWHIIDLSLFGSVLRVDFRPDSDVDVLVAFAPHARLSLFDLIRMRIELEDLFGRAVDLVERCSIEASHNPIRRQEILTTAQEVYHVAA